MDDIIMLSIRGVQCTNLRRESSNSLLCVSGHPTLSVDGGKVNVFISKTMHVGMCVRNGLLGTVFSFVPSSTVVSPEIV